MSRKHSVDAYKPQKVAEMFASTAQEQLEMLFIFDARALQRETRQELLRLLPELVRVGHAWKAEFMERGCLCCHKKRTAYGAGGFCNTCAARVYNRMRSRFRKLVEGRNIPAEIESLKESLALKYNAARRLLS